jgi:hypothetical protein
VVVQIVVLAEDKKIQGLFSEQGFHIKSCSDIAPIQVAVGLYPWTEAEHFVPFSLMFSVF